jgi:hypothetical protein
MGACAAGHLSVAQYLVDRRADINAHRIVSNNLKEKSITPSLIDTCDCTTILVTY